MSEPSSSARCSATLGPLSYAGADSIAKEGRPDAWQAAEDIKPSVRRRHFDDSFLAEVARIAHENPTQPNAAVSKQLGTVKRNAARWIKFARRGFPTD